MGVPQELARVVTFECFDKFVKKLFHFKCDNCRIVSNYAWNLT
jgi:predicted  nucleic acid-binding Zn ribbon protein